MAFLHKLFTVLFLLFNRCFVIAYTYNREYYDIDPRRHKINGRVFFRAPIYAGDYFDRNRDEIRRQNDCAQKRDWEQAYTRTDIKTGFPLHSLYLTIGNYNKFSSAVTVTPKVKSWYSEDPATTHEFEIRSQGGTFYYNKNGGNNMPIITDGAGIGISKCRDGPFNSDLSINADCWGHSSAEMKNEYYISPVPCECGYEMHTVWIEIPVYPFHWFGGGAYRLVCKNIDECRENHGCGAHSTCNDLPGSYECICDDGFAVKGSNFTKEKGEAPLECVPKAIGTLQADTDYDSFIIKHSSSQVLPTRIKTIRIEASRINPFDKDVKEEIGKANIRTKLVTVDELKAGVEYEPLMPGTSLELQLYALLDDGSEDMEFRTTRTASTSCSCPQSPNSEAPSSFEIKQINGFLEFFFVDNSVCADTFMFTRFELDDNVIETGKGTPLASTYNIFKNGIKDCGKQQINPGREARDDLRKNSLVIGRKYKYDLSITSSVTAQTYTLPVSATHVVQWEASIAGEVTTNPDLGAYPVENVLVSCTLLGPNITVEKVTDEAGKYKCSFRDDQNLNNYGYNFTNDGEYTVEVRFNKTTNTNSGKIIQHEFFCRGGVQNCTLEPLSVKLKHLEFSKPVVTYDETAVPINGKVSIANTNGCPLSKVQICLTEYVRNSVRDTSVCTETDSLGEYTILASIDSVVGLKASYFQHEMVPSGNTIWVENGIRIVDGNEYEGFDFEDGQVTDLIVEVGGGVCNIDLGKSTLELKVQGCILYSKQLEHEGFRNTFEVPAHALELEIKNIQKNNNGERRAIIEYFEGEQKRINLTDTQEQNAEDSVLFQYEGVARILPKFYKVRPGQLLKVAQPPVEDVCSPGDLPYDALQAVQDNQFKSYSFHTLDDKTFHLLSVEIKMYIDDDLPMCDRFPEGANFSLTNQLGYSDGTKESDIEALENELQGEGVAQSVINILGRCNVGCSLPVLPENQSMAPVPSGAQVEFNFLTGYPNFFEPYTRLLTVKSIGLFYPVDHTCEVVVKGSRTLENFGSFTLPQSKPIMALRDPPGSRSYSYYKNVETKIELVSKHYDRSRKWNVDVLAGFAGKTSDEIGFVYNTKISDIEAGAAYVGKWEENVMEEYNEGIHSGTLSATWSYETSQDVWTAGKSSDTFVVPSLNIVFNEKRDLSWDAEACRVIDKTKTEFDLESNSNKKLFSFVSHHFISKEEIPRLEGLINERLARDTSGFTQSQQNEHNEEIRVLKDSLNQWKDIIQDHDTISTAAKDGDMNKLLGASTYVEQKVVNDLPEEVKNFFKGYTRPFAPKTLTSNVDNPEEYNSFKFDGGGSLLKYELSHEALRKQTRRDGGDEDNYAFSSSNGFKMNYKAAIGGWVSLAKPIVFGAKVVSMAKNAINPLGAQSVNWGGAGFGRRRLENETNLGLDEVEINRRRELFQFGLDFLSVKVEHRIQLKQDSTSIGSAVGFVLGDENSGDYFDVDVFMDKQYGTFVFHTVAGESKCPVEPGTTPREVPFFKINKSPSTPVLPNEKMIFKLYVQNQGTDLTGFDIYQDLRTNTNGLALTANSRSLAAPVPIEKILAGEGYETLLTVSRGPELYEYPPITLMLRSACEYRRNIGQGNLIALSGGNSSQMPIQISNAVDAEGKPIIKFERPCPVIFWADSLESIRNSGNKLILNLDTYKDDFKIIIRNPNRNLYKLADVGRLEQIKVWYRRLGVGEWTRAQDSTGKLIDMKTLDEDAFGYIEANWNIKSLFDGTYEVYVECNCESFFGAPKSFEKTRLESLTIVQDTKRPQLYGLPTPFEVITLNSPVNFVFSEPIQCLEPFTFKIRAIIEGSDTFYDEDNLVVLCEGRSIRISFEKTFRWEKVMGRSLVMTIQDVLDLNSNVLEDPISHQIRFPSPISDSVAIQFNLRINTDCLSIIKGENVTQKLANDVANMLSLDIARVSIVGMQCMREGLLLAKVTVSPPGIDKEQGNRRLQNSNYDPALLLETLTEELTNIGSTSTILMNATLDPDSVVITTMDSASGRLAGSTSGPSIIYTPESPSMTKLDQLETEVTETGQKLDLAQATLEENKIAMQRLELILIGLATTLVAIIVGTLVALGRMKYNQKQFPKKTTAFAPEAVESNIPHNLAKNPIYEETL